MKAVILCPHFTSYNTYYVNSQMRNSEIACLAPDNLSGSRVSPRTWDFAPCSPRAATYTVTRRTLHSTAYAKFVHCAMLKGFSWEPPTGLKMCVDALVPPVGATRQPGATKPEALTGFYYLRHYPGSFYFSNTRMYSIFFIFVAGSWRSTDAEVTSLSPAFSAA